MYQELLHDAKLFELLLRIDKDLADEARREGCACGGVLHAAHYPRKPRGGPEHLSEAYAIRFSFCCAIEGCRRRVTPPSLRFLGRKVFFAVVVLLIPALRSTARCKPFRHLRELVGVSARTARRWQRFWREAFAQSRLWQGARGQFVRPVRRETLPSSLLEIWAGVAEPASRVVCVLRFLSPITTGRGLSV